MKTIIITSLLMFSTIGFAQSTIQDQLNEIRTELNDIKANQNRIESAASQARQEISSVKTSLDATNTNVDSLSGCLEEINSSIEALKKDVANDISETNKTVNAKEESINSSIQQKVIIGGISLLVVTLILGTIMAILRKKMSNSGDVIENIKKTQEELSKAQKGLEEESVKLDSKLVEILEKRIDSEPATSEATNDHSLVLKVADEITRIELNLSRMDSSVKGHKQLSKAVSRIKDNYLAKGYEITDMLNKPYNEGMRINADFVLDENLEPGTRIITFITKPQVLFNGEMIQKAIVTVTQNV